jgi:oligopeptide transport system ATP-binding protein
MKICLTEKPHAFEINAGHYSACWLNHPQAPKTTSNIEGGITNAAK